MANRLKVAMIQALVTLWRQGWSQRQIARRLGIDRETVGRYVRRLESLASPANLHTGSAAEISPNPANLITGSAATDSGGTGPPLDVPSANPAILITGSGELRANPAKVITGSEAQPTSGRQSRPICQRQTRPF